VIEAQTSGCTLSVTALGGLPVADVNGTCYPTPQQNYTCYQGISVLGFLVQITETCPVTSYCCFLGVQAPPVIQGLTVAC